MWWLSRQHVNFIPGMNMLTHKERLSTSSEFVARSFSLPKGIDSLREYIFWNPIS